MIFIPSRQREWTFRLVVAVFAWSWQFIFLMVHYHTSHAAYQGL